MIFTRKKLKQITVVVIVNFPDFMFLCSYTKCMVWACVILQHLIVHFKIEPGVDRESGADPGAGKRRGTNRLSSR